MPSIPALVRSAMLPRAIVGVFVRNQCTLGPEHTIPKSELHVAFLEWAERNGWRGRMTFAAFGHYLLKSYPGLAPRRRRVEGGGRIWVYAGIALNEY